ALVTFGMWVPWCLLDARFAGFCGSGPCPRIGPAGAAYAVLMFIGPPLAGIRGHGPLLHCGLRPLMRGSAPAPQCKGRYPLANPSGPRSSLILVYQNQLSIRGQGAVPAPTRPFGVIQTMLLALVTLDRKSAG